jgi:hypothetical protein
MRSFTIIGIYSGGKKIRFDGGRYISDIPSRAAAKAFNKACQHLGKKGRASMVVKLQETTAGSQKKTFSYKVVRVKEHREVIRDGIPITYMYTTKVHSI